MIRAFRLYTGPDGHSHVSRGKPMLLKKLAAFDDELIARNLSPGGSADLLIVTAFLAEFSNRD